MLDDYAKLQRQKQKMRSIVQALLLHVCLIAVFLFAWLFNEQPEADTAGAVSVSVLPPPSAEVETKLEAKPQKPLRESIQAKHADIDTARKAKPKVQPSPVPTPQPSPKPNPKPSPKPKAPEVVEKKPAPTVQNKAEKSAPKSSTQLPADAQAEEAARRKARKDALDRAMKQAGSGSNVGSGSGSSYTPSESYKGRIAALLRRHTRFDPETVEGNPIATIEIRMSADGTILGRPRLLRSSGNAAWDEAAMRAAIAAGVIPRDPSLGRAPESLVYEAGPKD